MATFFKSLRDTAPRSVNGNGHSNGNGNGAHPAQAALEALIARAEKAAETLRSLESVTETAAALDAMQERFAAVESRLAGIEEVASKLAAAEAQAERAARVQEETERRVAESTERAEQVRSELGEVGAKIDAALALRGELGQFLSLENPVATMRAEADALRTQLAELGDNVNRMRAQHDDALTAHRHTTARLANFSDEHQAANARLEDVVRRVQGVERSLEPLTHAVDAVPAIQHQLAVLKALADQVAQKAAALEQQREAVDRAATQVTQLGRLDRELDTWIRRQEEQIRRFGTIEAKVSEVQATHVKVAERHEELQAAHVHLDEGHRAARQALTDLREQMRKSSESFELENRGLHAVSERIGDLRTAVKECEARLEVLDAASQGAAAVQAQIATIGAQAETLGQEVTRLSDEAQRLATIRQDAERLMGLANEVGAGMARVSELKPQVDEVTQQLAALKGTQEMMADGLEQMNLAYTEMTRVRESQGEVQAWLANADVWTRKVQAQVKELSGMEPAVERIRGEVEQVKAAMVEIQARREQVDEMQQRLAKLSADAAELGERSGKLWGRMDAAEARFGALDKESDAAQLVAETINGVIASVGEAERRINFLDDAVRALEARRQQLEELEEGIRILGQEIEQRQGALDKATEHLARASALRQEAADAAQQLDEVNRRIAGTLEEAEQRSSSLDRTTGALERRAAALKPIERQLAHFEGLLAKWESAQAEAARALEQMLARQGAIDALDAQVKHVFGIAERAVADVQTIAESRHDIEEARALLESTQAQFKAAETALNGFEARQRKLERAEQRLARAEALAIDVRSTVESLQAQRTVVDHVIERAGALQFQMKQAEALVETLKRERMLACDLRAAVSAVEKEDDES